MQETEKGKPKEENKHPHHGHRKRMRERFMQSRLDSFQPHEVLELLLSFVRPQANTNPTAHELIRQFHSLSGVLDADVDDLKQVNGISDTTAVFLHMMPQLFRLYQLDKIKDTEAMDSVQKLMDYAKKQFLSLTKERLLLICLNESLQIIHCETISDGTTYSAQVDIPRIVECAIHRHSSQIVLTHNHPNTKATMSDADIFATEQLRKLLSSMKIRLLDHIIVGKYGDAISMRQCMGWDV